MTVREILVDGDSCPVMLRDFLRRVSVRRGIPVRFLANRALPESRTGEGGAGNTPGDAPRGDTRREGVVFWEVITASSVDDELLHRGSLDILVVTRDIPLAEQLVHRGIPVMNDRGRLFDRDSVGTLRSERDAAEQIRRMGLERMPRGSSYGSRELKAFADSLDRFLATRTPLAF